MTAARFKARIFTSPGETGAHRWEATGRKKKRLIWSENRTADVVFDYTWSSFSKVENGRNVFHQLKNSGLPGASGAAAIRYSRIFVFALVFTGLRGIASNRPTLSFLSSLMWFAVFSAATVTPYFAAISLSVSPFAMTWVRA